MKQFLIGEINLWLRSIFFLFLLGVVFCFFKGRLGCMSVILGGSAWIIPSFYFNWYLKRVMKKFNVQKMLQWFLIGEAAKLLLSFVLLILILLFISVDKFSFLAGYVVTVLVFSLSLVGLGVKHG